MLTRPSHAAVSQVSPDRPHAVVIGSGFGGMALAIRLQSAGIATTVIEARDKPGGRAYFWEKDGFTFDAGPTIITAPFLFEELWALCGRRMEDDVRLTALDPFPGEHEDLLAVGAQRDGAATVLLALKHRQCRTYLR